MRTIYQLILPLLLISVSFTLNGQIDLNTSMLGAQSQVCMEISDSVTLKKGLNSGIKAFIPHFKDSKELSIFFRMLAEYYMNNNDSAIFLINTDNDAVHWDNAIKSSGLDQYTHKKLTRDELFTYPVNQGNIFAFSRPKSKYSYTLDDHISIINDSTKELKKLTNDFLMVKPDSSYLTQFPYASLESWIAKHEDINSTTLRSLISTWLKTGKRPHFVVSDHQSIDKLIKLIDKLNTIPFRSVKFIKNDSLFAPVMLQENNYFLSGGRISFPTPDHYRLQIIPTTEGYRFSPDIFMFTYGHRFKEIVVRTFPLELSDQLAAHFHFNNTHSPCLPRLSDYYSSSDSLLVVDKERKRVFSFNGQNSYLDCGTGLNLNFENPITICAWIKPTKTDLNHSIVGIGRNFSFKIHYGTLTFTLAGISDVNFPGNEIELNKWQHVAAVYEPNRRICLFLNGRKIGERKTTRIVKSEHSVVIGSNIWGEFYQGLIDDLIIWNRALSDNEIKNISQLKAFTLANKPFKWEWIIGITILIVLATVFIWIKRNKKTKLSSTPNSPVQVKRSPQVVLKETKQHHSSILTFGEFKIFTANKENLAQGLSPKEKQLFLYLLWFTIRTDEGGVSSSQMSEDLWSGMPASKAKNNRSTYMQRLRKQLTGATGIQITYSQNKKWNLIIPDEFYCDLLDYNNALILYKKESNINTLENYLNIIAQGAFLPETNHEVIDNFKSEIENEIIHNLTNQTSLNIASQNQSITPLLTGTIKKHDPLNELALSLELKWLTNNGHHGRAIDTFHLFCREYENVYGEKLGKDMNELLI